MKGKAESARRFILRSAGCQPRHCFTICMLSYEASSKSASHPVHARHGGKGVHGVDGFRAVWPHGCVSHLWAASDAQRLFATKFVENLQPFLTRPFQAAVPSVPKEN